MVHVVVENIFISTERQKADIQPTVGLAVGIRIDVVTVKRFVWALLASVFIDFNRQ